MTQGNAKEAEVWALVNELKVCIRARNLHWGKQIHTRAMQGRNDLNIYVATTLINMYAKCGSMADAQKVFDSVGNPDTTTWNTLIMGYTVNGKAVIAVDLYARMKSEGFVPDRFTFVAALKACSSIVPIMGKAECLQRGREIHSEIGCFDIYVQSALIDMYCKCDNMVEAQEVFDSIKHPNVVAWNTLILGYVDNGQSSTALLMFARMKHQKCVPDTLTYIAALKACASLATNLNVAGKSEIFARGKEIHLEIDYNSDISIKSTLVDMYGKCGSMSDAQLVFDSIKRPDVICWTALISGHVENGEGNAALHMFSRMKSRGCTPDSFTFVSVLKACALVGALEYGRKIHAEITDVDKQDVILVSSLVDFYAKCGSLVEAHKVFDMYHDRMDLKTWTSLLAGYSCLGDAKTAFALFERMCDSGVKPDAVTFLSLLTCCNHAGLVAKASDLFELMFKYEIVPTLEHYNCMVDTLGRSNKLDEAVVLLRNMLWRPNTMTWTTVLCACRAWKNVGVGSLAFQSLVCLNEGNASAYLQMACIYGSKGMWNEQTSVLRMRQRVECSAKELNS